MALEAMTYQDYYAECVKAKGDHPEWRWGQTLFIIAWQIKPELVAEMHAVGIDPFNVGMDPKGQHIIDTFLSHLHEFWESPPRDYPLRSPSAW